MVPLHQAIDEHIEAETKNTLTMVDAIILILGLLLAATFIWLYRQITVPISEMQMTMDQIEREKDLRLRVKNTSRSEVGLASMAFNGMVDSFQQVLGNVSRSVDHLSSSAIQVSVASPHVRKLADDANSAITEINSGIRQTVAVVSGISTASAQHASTSDEISGSVAKISRLAVENMQAVDETSRLAKDMEKLACEFQDMVGVFKI